MYQVATLPTSAKSWLVKTITIDHSLIDLQWKSHSQVSQLSLNQSIYQVCTKIIKTIDGNIRPYEKHQGCYKIHLWKHAKENSPHHI